MDSSDKKIVPVSGVVSSKSSDEPSVDQEVDQSSESEVVVAPPTTPPAQNYQLVVPGNDREYGCRYCEKKFSNKQALGGHQNAHKVQRLMEKNTHDHRKSFDYFRPSSSSYHARAGGPLFTSYKHRYFPYGWGCTAHHHSGACSGIVPYNSHPLLPPSAAFPGWPAPRPSPFPLRAHYTLPLVHIRLPNFGAGTSNATAAAARRQDIPPPGFLSLGLRPARGNNGPNPNPNPNPNPPINVRDVPEVEEEDEDSDVDLTLKL